MRADVSGFTSGLRRDRGTLKTRSINARSNASAVFVSSSELVTQADAGIDGVGHVAGVARRAVGLQEHDRQDRAKPPRQAGCDQPP
jgi:hypothetical protein